MLSAKIKLIDGTYQTIDGDFGVLCFGPSGQLGFFSKLDLLSNIAGVTEYLTPVEGADIYNFEHSHSFEQYISGVTNGVIVSSGAALRVRTLNDFGVIIISPFFQSVLYYYRLEEENGVRIDSKNSLNLSEYKRESLLFDSNGTALRDSNGLFLEEYTTYSSVVGWATGVKGNAANFTGNAYLESAIVPTQSYSNGLAVSAWVDFYTGRINGIGGRPSYYSYESGDYAAWHDGSNFRFRIYDSSLGGYLGRKFPSATNGLQHVCFTWDGSTSDSNGISGYVNSQYISSSVDDSAGSFSAVRNTYPVAIGRVPRSGDLFSGMIDQFFIVSSGIYSGDIFGVYGSGNGIDDDILL